MQATREPAIDFGLGADSTGLALRFLSAFISEEVAHDLASPIRFLEQFLEALGAGSLPEAEDLEIAREEIVRLRSLMTALRGARPPKLLCQTLSVEMIVFDVEQALRCVRDDARLGVSMDSSVALVGDRGLFSFVFRAMAAGVLGPMGGGRAIDLTFERDSTQSLLIFSGDEGVEGPPAPLVPWDTTSPLALELSLARRVVRAHGYRLTFETARGRPTARIAVPHPPEVNGRKIV